MAQVRWKNRPLPAGAQCGTGGPPNNSRARDPVHRPLDHDIAMHNPNARPSASPLQALGLTALAVLSLTAQAATSCCSRSGAGISPVVELYTSEDCNSRPPADRWLSGLKAEPGVVALAFPVDYWDRMEWRDRLASLAYTQRQAQQ